MSYQFAGATLLRHGIDSIWETVDISSMDCNAIFSTFRQGSVELSHTATTDHSWISLAELRRSIPLYIGQKTLNQFLVELGNESLPTQPVAPNYRSYHARYADVYEAGYTVRAFDHNRHPDMDLPLDDKRDLLLSKEGVDFQTLWPYCMVTVNGHLHRVAGSSYGLVVLDGARSMQIGQRTQIGLISFQDVGVLDYIPITPDMIYKTHEDQKYVEFINIHVPKSMEGKTPFLVIGGYLHLLDNIYKVVGDQMLRVHFKHLMWPERFFESRHAIDLKGLNLDVIAEDPRRVSVEELHSDSVLKAYLTLSQSFIVLIDSEQLYVKRHGIENTGIPGRYIVPEAAYKQLPLQGAYGRMLEYLLKREYGQYSLSTVPSVHNTFNFRSTDWHNDLVLNDNTYSARPFEQIVPHLLEIGRIGS